MESTRESPGARCARPQPPDSQPQPPESRSSDVRLPRLGWFLALAVLIVFFAGIAPAEDREVPDLPTQVRALIQQLDAETLAARAAAEKKLMDLGPGVLPALPAPELLPNASVRESVRR